MTAIKRCATRAEVDEAMKRLGLIASRCAYCGRWTAVRRSLRPGHGGVSEGICTTCVEEKRYLQ